MSNLILLPMLRAALDAYVRYGFNEPTMSVDEASSEVDRLIRDSTIETKHIMPINTIYAVAIAFFDECEMRMIAFYDDAHKLTHLMISSDDTPYAPINIP